MLHTNIQSCSRSCLWSLFLGKTIQLKFPARCSPLSLAPRCQSGSKLLIWFFSVTAGARSSDVVASLISSGNGLRIHLRTVCSRNLCATDDDSPDFRVGFAETLAGFWICACPWSCLFLCVCTCAALTACRGDSGYAAKRSVCVTPLLSSEHPGSGGVHLPPGCGPASPPQAPSATGDRRPCCPLLPERGGERGLTAWLSGQHGIF